jgi:hypothetical protein
MLLAQLRPEFIEAVDAANSSWWFALAWIIPPALIFPSVVWRWGGCIIAPVAVIGCYVAFVSGYANLDRVIQQNAVTDDEIDVWASDTDRTFAPVLTGPIFSVVYTAVCLCAAYTGRLIFRLCFFRRRSNLEIVTEGQPARGIEDGNPYSPPRQT